MASNLEKRSRAAAGRRNRRLDEIVASKATERQASMNMAEKRLAFDRSSQRDSMSSKRDDRFQQNILQQSGQRHARGMQSDQQSHLQDMQRRRNKFAGGERGKDRSFRGRENYLSRSHDFGMQGNRLSQQRDLAQSNQAYQRSLDRYKSTPRTFTDPDTGLSESNPDYDAARLGYKRNFPNNAGDDFAAGILGGNNQQAKQSSNESRYAGPQYNPYQPPLSQPQISDPRNVAPRQYGNDSSIVQNDGVYEQAPSRSIPKALHSYERDQGAGYYGKHKTSSREVPMRDDFR